MDLAVGDTVTLSDGRIALVQYIGPAAFALGEWIGCSLSERTGKNDGSVQGQRYFDCEMGYGMFVKRPSIVEIIEQHAPPPPPVQRNGVAKKPASRPSSVAPAATKRLSTIGDAAGTRRASINASSPSPATRRPSSMLRSPTKSPTKQLASAATSAASTPRTGTPSITRTPSVSTRPASTLASKRTSMAPPPAPAARTSRPSISGTAAQTGISGRLGSNRLSLAPKANGRPLSGRLGSVSSRAGSQLSSGDGSGHDTPDEDRMGSPVRSDRTDAISTQALSPVLTRTTAAERHNGSPGAPSRGTNSPAATRTTAASTTASREIEDLKTKLRLMEKKRMEDRDKLKTLEKIQGERDKFESIIQKLQAKYQPQQQEITELRKQLKESATRFEEVENMQGDHDLVLEMATLDREMAEETADVLKTELEALKQKTEELELEVDILREENAELGGEMSAEEKASAGWLQMERNNDRLREALMRLRDMTQQQEEDLRVEIKSLELDLRELSGVKEQFDVSKEKLAQSEASIEDLRQQLDNALGAEDMIEELTERNMSMNEQIEELRVTIEDLESLKELNDELEINHIETEKEMQEDIDFKDSLIFEQARRATQQDETLDDMEYTLSRFRELVTNLQSDLEDMRASHAVTETESEQLSSRSRAMLDLNMKLQVSAAKTQIKTIDLELRRLDAQEASDHLAIVQLFLPEAFQTDRDSVLALLRFKRVAFKTNLLQGFVKERINGQLPQGHEDDIFAACDVLDKLTWVSSMCDRFVNAISHCSVQQFAKYEGAMYELEPVERALNGWIDGLRRDDLKEKHCASELQRSIALMSHLAEIHIAPGLESFADDIHMRALLMQSHLESTASALTAAKAMVTSIIPIKDEDDELAQHFIRKADAIISQTRSAKVIAGKAVRSLEDMKTRSLSLMPDTLDSFEQCEQNTQELASFSRRAGEDLYALLHEEGRSEPYTYIEVQSSVHRSTNTIFSTSESDIFSTFSNKLRTLTTSLADLASLASDLSQTQEFERRPNPWLLRSQELKASRTVPVDAEEEMRRLKDDNHERARLIAMRDQTLEEAGVKIELLESRMRDATKKNERITELEKRLEEAKKREAELTELQGQKDKELSVLDAEREKWKKIAGTAQVVGEVAPGSKAGHERAVATAREMEDLKDQIKSLQAAIRYLREENRYSRYTQPQNLAWLEAPLLKPKSKKEQARNLIETEGQDVLAELLNLTAGAKVYDLKESVGRDNRLAWRPAKATAKWHVAKQRENFEAWKGWSGEVSEKGRGLLADSKLSPLTMAHKKERQALARVDINMSIGMGKGSPGEVKIVDPEEFDGFKHRMGFA